MAFSPSQSLSHPAAESHIIQPVSGAVQTTVRVGRVLPLAWESADYARFMILTTLLGGYFGSRLMQNLREDKGYTYGIYARTQLYRGVIVFYITADVAGSVAKEAEQEIIHELRRLAEKPVGEEELNLVKVVLAGDFIRSVDGTFELSERYRQMHFTDVTEQLTTHYFDAVQHVTPAQLQALAQQYLTPLTTVTAGPAAEQ
jgi:predicted Zn-dependent peptidase